MFDIRDHGGIYGGGGKYKPRKIIPISDLNWDYPKVLQPTTFASQVVGRDSKYIYILAGNYGIYRIDRLTLQKDSSFYIYNDTYGSVNNVAVDESNGDVFIYTANRTLLKYNSSGTFVTNLSNFNGDLGYIFMLWLYDGYVYGLALGATNAPITKIKTDMSGGLISANLPHASNYYRMIVTEGYVWCPTGTNNNTIGKFSLKTFTYEKTYNTFTGISTSSCSLLKIKIDANGDPEYLVYTKNGATLIKQLLNGSIVYQTAFGIIDLYNQIYNKYNDRLYNASGNKMEIRDPETGSIIINLVGSQTYMYVPSTAKLEGTELGVIGQIMPTFNGSTSPMFVAVIAENIYLP